MEDQFVNYDEDRQSRIGVAEAIFAEGKTLEEFAIVLDSLVPLMNDKTFLVTRMNRDHFNYLSNKGIPVRMLDTNQRTAIIGSGQMRMLYDAPQVLIISGGTSDLSIVEETSITLSYHGIPSIHAVDIGVANLERLKIALKKLNEHRSSLKLVIAVAGFEGALFSVINSITRLPVVAVPSPQGYGLGGRGEAAMLSALQSCSAGVVTVNIGNGFGAALFASKLLGHLSSLQNEFGSVFSVNPES